MIPALVFTEVYTEYLQGWRWVKTAIPVETITLITCEEATVEGEKWECVFIQTCVNGKIVTHRTSMTWDKFRELYKSALESSPEVRK
jgi:hypothetical protein